jgi:hypothetical protein
MDELRHEGSRVGQREGEIMSKIQSINGVKTIVPQGKKTRQSSRVSVKARIRAQEAVRLRMAGVTHDNIAKQLGYSNAQGSYRAVMRELNATARDQSESNEGVRTLELKRLDQMLQSITAQTLQGDLGAVNTAIRISESRRGLLGIDAPKQLEARIRVDVMSWNQALRDILDIYREVHGNNPDATVFMERIDALANERFGSVVS